MAWLGMDMLRIDELAELIKIVEWEEGCKELERKGVENCPGHNYPMAFKTLLFLIQFLLAGANSNPNYLYLNCIDQIKERQLHSGYRWSALAALGEPADIRK